MTVDLERQLRQDRAMRDQALALVKADVAHLKSDYSQKGLGERATDKIKTSANDIYGEAVDVASEHRGPLVALVAALVLWFARNPILSLLGLKSDDGDSDDYLDDDEGARGRRSIFG